MSDLQQETLVEQATFGAGCFWGAEASFRTLPGVLDTRVGFARSAKGKSEVIEVVQVDFDAKVITYSRLIEHFWTLRRAKKDVNSSEVRAVARRGEAVHLCA